MFKVCKACSVNKPTSDFYASRSGSESCCKQCKNASTKARKEGVKNGTYKDTTSLKARVTSFISRATEIHGGVYTYEKVDYTGAHANVEIFCSGHQGYFLQYPAHHLRGHGCRTCGHATRSLEARLTLEEFIERAKAANPVGYDYSRVVYTGNSDKVTVGCSIHGDFEITPSNHFNGRGCVACSRKDLSGRFAWSIDKFIEAANIGHSEKYSYEKSEYINALTPIKINCKECNRDFNQTPSSHLLGSGCPSCATRGYSVGKTGSLYIMTCGDITKVGISNFHPNKRARQISWGYGKEFSVSRYWTFEDGNVAYGIEGKILRLLRSKYKAPTDRFHGYTECFFDVDMALLITEIELELSRINSESLEAA